MKLCFPTQQSLDCTTTGTVDIWIRTGTWWQPQTQWPTPTRESKAWGKQIERKNRHPITVAVQTSPTTRAIQTANKTSRECNRIVGFAKGGISQQWTEKLTCICIFLLIISSLFWLRSHNIVSCVLLEKFIFFSQDSNPSSFQTSSPARRSNSQSNSWLKT